MPKFLRIELIHESESIFLTEDGTENADYCKLEIPNLEDLLRTEITVFEKSASGKNIRQSFQNTDKEFEINILTWIGRNVWESIRELLNQDIEIIITENQSGIWTEIFNREVCIIGISANNPRNDRFHQPKLRLITI